MSSTTGLDYNSASLMFEEERMSQLAGDEDGIMTFVGCYSYIALYLSLVY